MKRIEERGKIKYQMVYNIKSGGKYEKTDNNRIGSRQRSAEGCSWTCVRPEHMQWMNIWTHHLIRDLSLQKPLHTSPQETALSAKNLNYFASLKNFLNYSVVTFVVWKTYLESLAIKRSDLQTLDELVTMLKWILQG